MVKFGHYLISESVPEWKNKYLNYKHLKKLLKKITQTLRADKEKNCSTGSSAHQAGVSCHSQVQQQAVKWRRASSSSPLSITVSNFTGTLILNTGTTVNNPDTAVANK